MSEQENEAGLVAVTAREIPLMTVEVLPGNSVSHGGEQFAEGDTFEVEGLTAVALMQNGHVKVTGVAT